MLLSLVHKKVSVEDGISFRQADSKHGEDEQIVSKVNNFLSKDED